MAADAGLSGDIRLAPALEALRQRRHGEAEAALIALPAAVRQTPAWALLRGVTLTKLSRIDEAADVLRLLVRGPEPWASEGAAALADALHLDQRHAELQQLVEQAPAWAATPRGRLFEARLLTRSDPEQALDTLLAVMDGPGTPELQRLAGFDAVKLLDRLARYREAHALASRLHAMATPFDQQGFLARLRLQQRLLDKGAAWCSPRAATVRDVALIVGLPRSGTTLLEQMLDAHPEVSGIGEHEGISTLAAGLVAAGAWPYRLNHLDAGRAGELQRSYLDSARQCTSKPTAHWTVDKSLLSWQWLPALAAVMPGAIALRVLRDPRDMAISAFLSPLDAAAFGWTSRLDWLHEIVALERSLVPQALQVLQIPHETVVYEDLVADPAGSIAPLLGRMNLGMDARVLSPQDNTRTAVTLSFEQVRRPINDTSIGRWRHYEFAFDARWDGLASAHAAGRRFVG